MMSKLIWAALVAVQLLLSTNALPQCNSKVVSFPGEKLTFAVVGDWGRVGAIDSLFSPHTINMCATTGQCCSNLQSPQNPDNFDYSDVLDGPQQLLAATLLDQVCGDVGCQFVLGMGDNFYPCGADAFESGLNRFESDWSAIYQSPQTPALQGLVWYNVLGNHDYGFAASPQTQMNYSQQNPLYALPSGYYSRTFKAGSVSMQVEFLDETPFIGKYAHPKPSGAYYTPYLASLITPSYINSEASPALNMTSGICNIPTSANASYINGFSDAATGQIPWLKSCLESSNSTWNTVVGHYALYGSDTNYAQNTSKTNYPGNCGAFASVAELITEYDVAAYFNGHDHTQTHADPLGAGVLLGEVPTYGNRTYLVSGPDPATQYFTLGNGGSVQWADGVTLAEPKSYNNWQDVVYNSNIQYPASALASDGSSDNAAVGEGFAIVTVEECVMRVDFYSIEDGTAEGNDTPVHTAVIDKCGTATAGEAASMR